MQNEVTSTYVNSKNPMLQTHMWRDIDKNEKCFVSLVCTPTTKINHFRYKNRLGKKSFNNVNSSTILISYTSDRSSCNTFNSYTHIK